MLRNYATTITIEECGMFGIIFSRLEIICFNRPGGLSDRRGGFYVRILEFLGRFLGII